MPEVTVALIKPDAVRAGDTKAILEAIVELGFEVVFQEKRTLARSEAEALYAEHTHEDWFAAIVAFMCSGALVVLVLRKEDAVKAWRQAIGHRWPPEARKRDPECLRARFGSEGLGANALHGSDSPAAVHRELRILGAVETPAENNAGSDEKSGTV